MDVHTNHDLPPDLASAIEALRIAEERALEGQLALEIMHEIKNPIEALGHLTYLADIEADKPNKVREYMRLADEQMSTIRRIVKQTLGFAKASDTPQPMELVVLTEAALRIHQRTIQEKNVRLIKDLPEGAVAHVYKGEILQVISNLIVNAIDALPDDGILCLRLRKRGNEVQLLVADNGHGIPHEHCDKIFKPFFTTKEDRGTGLGLALSKRIIDRHRGRIRMRSSIRPGRSGTAFRISLPAHNQK
ncbi:MAG TPA: HAMP domain-containing sensor histidine kinase [Edaphobacter sp.]|nr:HAMP domain-containing sensor histidine kinase [Edaphobacter sp.]